MEKNPKGHWWCLLRERQAQRWVNTLAYTGRQNSLSKEDFDRQVRLLTVPEAANYVSPLPPMTAISTQCFLYHFSPYPYPIHSWVICNCLKSLTEDGSKRLNAKKNALTEFQFNRRIHRINISI